MSKIDKRIAEAQIDELLGIAKVSNAEGWINELRLLQAERKAKRLADRLAKEEERAKDQAEALVAKNQDLQTILGFLGILVSIDRIADGQVQIGDFLFSANRINWGMMHQAGGKRVADKSRCEFTLYVKPVQDPRWEELLAWYEGRSLIGDPNQYNTYHYDEYSFNAPRWPCVGLHTDGLHEVDKGWDDMKADLADAFDALGAAHKELQVKWEQDQVEYERRKLQHAEQEKHQREVMDTLSQEDDNIIPDPTRMPSIEERLGHLLREVVDEVLDKHGLIY